MKYLAIIALLATSACHDRLVGSPQANLDKGRIACRDHVEYLQFNNSHGDTFTAHLKVDGKPYTC